MSEYKVRFKAEVEIELWIEADSPEHAEAMVRGGKSSDYSRVKSTVDISTGAIKVDVPTINILSVE